MSEKWPNPVRGRILVVDDQKNMRTTTGLLLRQAGHEVQEAASGEEALRLLEGSNFDLLLTDLRMEPMSGTELLARALQIQPGLQVIVMTAFGSIDSAVEAMRLGATDYLSKPFKNGELEVRVAKALENRALRRQLDALAGAFREKFGLGNIVGSSAPMREVIGRILRVAPTDATVLITGESGTGKELVARAIHAASRRAHMPFVPVNCAAIAPSLLESELFGHAKGAFTGAVRARQGLYEEADGGTLFLDEIGETDTSFQAKLLRALQEQEIRRVGESRPIHVNVRVVAATNQDLRQAIAERRFREDLYYRLNVMSIRLPPLRERMADVPLLAQHFLDEFNREHRMEKFFADSAIEKLLSYDYPGNVRELRNLVQQAALLSQSDRIEGDDFDLPSSAASRVPRPVEPDEGPRRLADVVDDAERGAIRAALERHRGDVTAAARELGISPTTLWRKRKRLEIL
ncbi:MAG: sigma-54 dependent transcriptional regulator [Pseudomonadota bacterium]|nr:MAG: Fis family transcriptional regulator [Pseudomonadota bacterium]